MLSAPILATAAPVFFSACPIQELGRPFLFKVLEIGTCPYFSADSATKNRAAKLLSTCRKKCHIDTYFIKIF
jgi:hypothetical protein